MKYRVNNDCIGCGLCASVCPAVFEMTSEGVAQASPDDVPPEYEAAARDAQQSCPVAAIEEAKGA